MSKENSKVKIGARVLSQTQLDKLLPNNDYIFKTIDIIRKHAHQYKQELGNNKNKESIYSRYLNRELDRNYNNVFSILGDRGSGKTSVLLTIKNKLTVKNTYDIMLPLIIPENMGQSSNILGWTICAFEKVIEGIETIIYSSNDKSDNTFNFFKNCRKYVENDLRKAFNELLKYYTYVNEEYRQILNINYDGLNEYREKTKEIVNAERELLNKFEEFITILIEIKKYVNVKQECSDKKEPIIYLFLDDVDLSTDKCLEIINMVLKYCSNPNIIVFVAGSYNTFLESITINLLKKDELLRNTNTYFLQEEKFGGKNALETRKILAKDILKKVLPPAYRFYMPKLKDLDKSGFVYSTRKNDDSSYYTLIELLKSYRYIF